MTSKEFLAQKKCSFNPTNSNIKAKKSVFYAFVITFSTMVLELIAGVFFNSMALLADGWHMSSHALALALILLAYILANIYAKDARFNFGSFKIEILSAYTSALFLFVVALLMAYHSIERLVNPKEIAYTQAIVVAFIGLFVNVFCMWLLKDGEHSHNHKKYVHKTHSYEKKDKNTRDLNLKAAYIHVLTDALTSVIAIIALCGGFWFGFWWLDSIMGLLGSILVFIWATGLLKQSGKILLDMSMDEEIIDELLSLSKNYGEIKDLHLLKISKNSYACVLSIKSQKKLQDLKMQFSKCKALAHLNIECI